MSERTAGHKIQREWQEVNRDEEERKAHESKGGEERLLKTRNCERSAETAEEGAPEPQKRAHFMYFFLKKHQQPKSAQCKIKI